MQLNKVLKKGIILVLLMTAIISCSLKKDNDKTTGVENNVANSNSSLISKQSVSQKIQKLQSDNVVYFGFDKYDLTQEYTHLLDQHAIFLCSHPAVKIIVEGHTDEYGTPEYNIALGERRANAVKTYLQSKGVNGERVTIVSYGKEMPAVQGNDESAYAKNRRAVLMY